MTTEKGERTPAASGEGESTSCHKDPETLQGKDAFILSLELPGEMERGRAFETKGTTKTNFTRLLSLSFLLPGA